MAQASSPTARKCCQYLKITISEFGTLRLAKLSTRCLRILGICRRFDAAPCRRIIASFALVVMMTLCAFGTSAAICSFANSFLTPDRFSRLHLVWMEAISYRVGGSHSEHKSTNTDAFTSTKVQILTHLADRRWSRPQYAPVGHEWRPDQQMGD